MLRGWKYLYKDGKEKPEQSQEGFSREPQPNGKAVGIDLGVISFCVTSDGSQYGNPKYYRRYEKKPAKKLSATESKAKGV